MHAIFGVVGTKVLGWVLPVVLGPLVYYVARYALNVSTAVDDLPAPIKRIAVVLIGAGLSAAFAALQVALPGECAALSADVAAATSGAVHSCVAALGTKAPVEGVVAALVAFVIHAIKKQNPRN